MFLLKPTGRFPVGCQDLKYCSHPGSIAADNVSGCCVSQAPPTPPLSPQTSADAYSTMSGLFSSCRPLRCLSMRSFSLTDYAIHAPLATMPAQLACDHHCHNVNTAVACMERGSCVVAAACAACLALLQSSSIFCSMLWAGCTTLQSPRVS